MRRDTLTCDGCGKEAPDIYGRLRGAGWLTVRTIVDANWLRDPSADGDYCSLACLKRRLEESQ